MEIIIDAITNKTVPILKRLIQSRHTLLVVTGIALGAAIYFSPSNSNRNSSSSRNKGTVDMNFLKNIWKFTKIAVPSLVSKQSFLILSLSVLLVIRTMLSISISSLNGQIVKNIVARNFPLFIKKISVLALYAFPACLVNSGLDYLNSKLSITFRQNITNHLNKKYFSGIIYYQLQNLDTRIQHPDQRFTKDIAKWAQSFSGIYSNISKPILDIVLFTKRLQELVGLEGPIAVILWYFLSGLVIKIVSPPFGRLIAEEQENQGLYRSCHSAIKTHSEQIAFYAGNSWEKERLRRVLRKVVYHIYSILKKRFFMGTFDSILVKYGATCLGYGVMGVPVFGKDQSKYMSGIGKDTSSITRDYIRNSSLYINLTKAIGRLIISYKELQNLAGFTSLISEIDTTLSDLKNGHLQLNLIEGAKYTGLIKGTYIKNSQSISFQNVPLVTPRGQEIISSFTLEIPKGTHTYIEGPNGCGKSGLFRILKGLWPLQGGVVYQPRSIIFIPQKPYLPTSTYRDQLIYPDTVEQMRQKGVTDADLWGFLRLTELEEVITKRGGLDKVDVWRDKLSGGQKQRTMLCRVMYHKPEFAILDECTGAINQDIQGAFYQYLKDLGITLITVSHRGDVDKYHNYVVRFDGEGGYEHNKIQGNNGKFQ